MWQLKCFMYESGYSLGCPRNKDRKDIFVRMPGYVNVLLVPTEPVLTSQPKVYLCTFYVLMNEQISLSCFCGFQWFHFGSLVVAKSNFSPEIWYHFFQRSIGCTVVEMLTGNPPFANCEPEVIFRVGSKPLEPRLPVGVSPDAKKFILAALKWLVLLYY